jgi:hypothetical protein
MSAQVFVDALLRRDIRVVAEGDQLRVNAPVGAMTDELRRQIKNHKGELLAHLTGASPARDRHELEAEPDNAHRCFEARKIATAVELAAHGATQVVRRLPEEAEDASSLRLSELFEDVCWACGKDAWWTKTCGERVCGVCHPKPLAFEKSGTQAESLHNGRSSLHNI